MTDNTVVVSTPPHVKSQKTTRGIMIDVCIALLPCAIAGIVFFGWQALVVELISVAACVATEFVYYFIAQGGFAKKCKNAGLTCKKWARQFDFTSVVTGLILALIVPADVKWYEILLGGVFAIALVKMFFGGTGKNLVNPAAAARIFMALSFSVSVFALAKIAPTDGGAVLTGASNLEGVLKDKVSAMNAPDLFLGTGVAGCIGETCKLAILVGFVYLCVRGVIKWWQPVLFIAVFGLTACLCSMDIKLFLPHILSGGVMFAAVFMFTDYVTSPKGVYGQLVYYVLGAVLLAVLRQLTKVEVASFAILLMNLFVPLIDKFIIRKPFGYVRQKKTKEGK